MAKRIHIITIHGMGNHSQTFDRDLRKKVLKQIKKTNLEHNTTFHEFHYNSEIQTHQDAMWKRMKDIAGNKLRGRRLRQFMLSNFSDAATFLNRAQDADSAYRRVHTALKQRLDGIYANVNSDESPILVVFASSLGCQVLSSYLWDAQKGRGIWAAGETPSNIHLMKDLRLLFTVGCNIPFFVSGEPQNRIIPISKPNAKFEWVNNYDKNDVLGWPLAPLSKKYAKLVQDVHVEVGLTAVGHMHYWKDNTVVKGFVKRLSGIYGE